MRAHRSNFEIPHIQAWSYFLILGIGFHSLGCGTTELTTVDPFETTETEDCLNCGLEPEPEHEVTDSPGYAIDVFPLEMTFFLDAMPEELHINEPLQITNVTEVFDVHDWHAMDKVQKEIGLEDVIIFRNFTGTQHLQRHYYQIHDVLKRNSTYFEIILLKCTCFVCVRIVLSFRLCAEI